jgi:hypothetical protein
MTGRVAYFLAHNDDEYFCSAHILKNLKEGNGVYVFHTTQGSSYRPGVETLRAEESRRFLVSLGVAQENIIQLGGLLGIADGSTPEHLGRLYDFIDNNWGSKAFSSVVTMAWEGGHIDHDATHILAFALACKWQVQDHFYEFPAYNSYRLPNPLFHVGRLIPGRGEVLQDKLTFPQAWKLFCKVTIFRSQWKSFIGLLPGTIYQLLILRQQQVRLVSEYRYFEPPHPGELFYTRRFGRKFAELKAPVEALFQRLSIPELRQ